MEKDKALRLDGCIIVFWLFGWDIVKEKVIGVFNECYTIGQFVEAIM